jgi:hypothetical protein
MSRTQSLAKWSFLVALAIEASESQRQPASFVFFAMSLR